MLARQIARYVCIAIVVVVFFFPIYWMLITSMKPQEEVLYYPPTFVPPEFTFRYYADGTPCPGSAPHGHLLLYFHTDPDPDAAQRFAGEFVDYGRVYVPEVPRDAT